MHARSVLVLVIDLHLAVLPFYAAAVVAPSWAVVMLCAAWLGQVWVLSAGGCSAVRSSQRVSALHGVRLATWTSMRISTFGAL